MLGLFRDLAWDESEFDDLNTNRRSTSDFDRDMRRRISLAAANVIGSTLERSVQSLINELLARGSNIDAYDGLSSKFTNFIRGAILANEEDEFYLDKINKNLMELEKIDNTKNVAQILRIYASLMQNVLFLSTETRDGIVTAFREQNTLENKMNESFSQVGTILLEYSREANYDDKTKEKENYIEFLDKVADNIDLLVNIDPNNEFMIGEIAKQIGNCFFRVHNPSLKNITSDIIKDNFVFFNNLEFETGVNFEKFLSDEISLAVL